MQPMEQRLAAAVAFSVAATAAGFFVKLLRAAAAPVALAPVSVAI